MPGRASCFVGVEVLEVGAGAREHGSTAGELLRAADEALYAAKRAGRDRVIIHPVIE